MQKWISSTEKRSFLKWFLEHHRLKCTDARRLLEFILNKPHILDNVSFTEKIKLSEKTIVISSMSSDEPGFEFYCYQRKTEDVSKALGELMLNPSGKLYIILHFHGKMFNQRYSQLIEIPAVDNIKQYEQYQRHAKEVDAIIAKVLLEKNIETLKKQIDDALDKRDKELFKKLIAQLEALEIT